MAARRLTTAYLRSAFFADGEAWADAARTLMEGPRPLGRVDGK